MILRGIPATATEAARKAGTMPAVGRNACSTIFKVLLVASLLAAPVALFAEASPGADFILLEHLDLGPAWTPHA